MTVAKRPMNGAVVAIVARPPRPFFMSAVVMRAERSMARSAAETVSCPTDDAVLAVVELQESGRHDLGDVALLVFLGEVDPFPDLVLLQELSDLQRELHGLLPGLVEGQEPLDEDRDGVDRQEHQKQHDPLDQGAHDGPDVSPIHRHS